MTLDKLAEIPDPTVRAIQAAEVITRGRSAVKTACEIRDQAIYEMLTAGMKPTLIARSVKVSVSQVKLVKKLREQAAA